MSETDLTPNDLETPPPDDMSDGEFATPELPAETAAMPAPGEPVIPPDAPSPPQPVQTLSPAPARSGGRQRAAFRLRPASLVAGLLLIALGVTFVWPVFSGGFILLPGAILAITLAGAALSLLAHWLASGRRARGALFLALLIALWGGLTAVFALERAYTVRTGWPLYLTALGAVALLTFLGDRQRDRRLILPGAIFVVAGLVALLVTQDQLPADLLGVARQGWPWLLIVLALGLVPLAFRRETPQR